MSLCVEPDAVDSMVWDMIGAHSGEMLGFAERGFRRRAKEIDEHIDSQRRETDELPLPTAEDVLRHIVMGEPYDDRVGFAYGYCLRHLCQNDGQLLVNNVWCPTHTAFIAKVEQEVVRAGVPADRFALQTLLWGGAPVPLPPIDDFPGIGFVSRVDAPDWVDALDGVELSGVQDDDVRDAIGEMRRWLRACADSERDLLCFVV